MSDFATDYKNTCDAVIDELKKTLDSIDPASLEKLTEAILTAEQVFFIGVGLSLIHI